jgi:hypothetical protein
LLNWNFPQEEGRKYLNLKAVYKSKNQKPHHQGKELDSFGIKALRKLAKKVQRKSIDDKFKNKVIIY